MKTETIRLGSVIPYGLGGPGSGAIGIIYTFLLQKYQLNKHSFIFINQIGPDLNEFVKIVGKEVHINIEYFTDVNIKQKTELERNLMRLDVMHKALMRLSEQYGIMNFDILKKIKEEIESKKFDFNLLLYSKENKKIKNLFANIYVNPFEDRFDIYLSIELKSKEQNRFLLYSGITLDSYFKEFFCIIKWVNENEIVITGKSKEVEIRLFLNEKRIQYKNLTPYSKAPYFEMRRANITWREKQKAYEDWIDTLPPAFAAIINESN